MKIVFRAFLLTLLIESITVFFRFGLGLRATRDTSWLAGFTFGYRIHHGYVGALVVVLATICLSKRQIRDWTIAIGLALVLSDLAHHFLVLWPLNGDPEFHFRYPKS
jgi:hypothetical protein